MEDYLALRVQLKQSIRAARVLQEGCGGADGGGKHKDNYGCFFGPSETVFTDKAAQETRNLWSKYKIINNKKFSSFPTNKVVDTAMKKNKVQWLRETRDYSFLSSPAASVPIKGDSVIDKKPIKLIVKIGNKRLDSPTTVMANSAEKSLSSRATTLSKQVEGKKKEFIKSAIVKGKEKEKESKYVKTAVNSTAVLKTVRNKQEEMKKGSRVIAKRRREESDDAVEQIRRMFGYYPSDYSDDEDEEDLNMEATFADIQKEEKRLVKIATMEDREELRKLEAAGSRKKMKHMIN